MLSSYGDRSFAGDLERFSHSENDYVAKVAGAILAKDVQGNLPEESRWREDELLDLLSLKGKGEEDSMSGNMKEKRTFKNSLVYPVGAKHVDVEAQLDSIMQDMCRFLNNQGGTVYIGMSDKGVPVGIQADLDYLCCNLDKYELFLHQRMRWIGRFRLKESNSVIRWLLALSFRILIGKWNIIQRIRRLLLDRL